MKHYSFIVSNQSGGFAESINAKFPAQPLQYLVWASVTAWTVYQGTTPGGNSVLRRVSSFMQIFPAVVGLSVPAFGDSLTFDPAPGNVDANLGYVYCNDQHPWQGELFLPVGNDFTIQVYALYDQNNDWVVPPFPFGGINWFVTLQVESKI